MSEQGIWDRLAPRYDLIVRFFGRAYPAIREALVEDLAGARRVLEVASGTGQFTLDLARLADEVVATDVSPEMVRRLTARLRAEAVSNVEAVVADAYELRFADASFDAAVAANVLHVMETPERALAQIHRVLRPGGALVAPTFCHGATRSARLLSRALSAVSPFVAHRRFDARGLVELVQAHGFRVERSTSLPGLPPSVYVLARRA